MTSSPPPADLRPLTTGELIDRGFSLYRRNFAGLFLLALLCQIAPLATSQALMAAMKLLPEPGRVPAYLDLTRMTLLSGVWIVGQILTFWLEVVVTYYLADAYLGRVPSIKSGFQGLKGRIGASVVTTLLNMALLGLTFVFPLAAMVVIYLGAFFYPPREFSSLLLFGAGALVLMVAAVAPVLIVFMRLMLTLPAVALEKLSGWKAVCRSAELVRFNPGLGPMYWGEMRLSFLLLPLFVIELLTLFLTSLPVTIHEIGEFLRHGTIGQIVAPPQTAMILSQILVLLAGSVLLPLYLIATTLFYYDVRIRREGFDLEFMAGQTGSTPA